MDKIHWNKKLSFFLWVLIWIPLSYLFPTHAHFPLGGFLSPLISFFLPFMGDPAHNTFSIDWEYVYFPALIFWTGGFTFMYITQHLMRRTKK